jgi:hypothetical protein
LGGFLEMSWLTIIFKLLLGLGLLLLVIVIGPLATIWSLNTLFPVLAIPYTWETWLAAALILTPFSFGTVKGSIRRDK